MSRVSLSKLVSTLVDKWSLEYLQLAKLGDVDAMVTLAEIQFSQRGYGQIAHNPVQARRWLEYAASKGDLTALATLKRLTAKAKAEKELAHQVRRYQIHNLENPKLGPDAIDKIDEITRTGKYADVKPTLVPPKEKDSLAQAEEMIAALEEKAKREYELKMQQIQAAKAKLAYNVPGVGVDGVPVGPRSETTSDGKTKVDPQA